MMKKERSRAKEQEALTIVFKEHLGEGDEQNEAGIFLQLLQEYSYYCSVSFFASALLCSCCVRGLKIVGFKKIMEKFIISSCLIN